MTTDAWHDRNFAEAWDEAGNLYTNPDRLNQLSLLAELLAASAATQLLDLGIGSAQVESAIKRQQPDFFEHCRVTGIDASAAMLELARQRCQSDGLDGIELLQSDFASLETVTLATPPNAAICVQALHEVPHEVKQSLFARVREWLPVGRPFFILDRFVYPGGPSMDDWRATWNWMCARVQADVLDFDEYHRQYSAKTDHIASVEDYRAWLEAAGFGTTCPYRCFNRALIIAR